MKSRIGPRTRGFGSDTFEDVIDERVEDRHGFVGDTSVRVDLLKDWGVRVHAGQRQV
jgi:hypothetical protein